MSKNKEDQESSSGSESEESEEETKKTPSKKIAESDSDSESEESESEEEPPKKEEPKKVETPKVEKKEPVKVETPKVEPKAEPKPAKVESSSEEDSDESESEEEPPKKEEPKKQETPKVESKEQQKQDIPKAEKKSDQKEDEESSEEDSSEEDSDDDSDEPATKLAAPKEPKEAPKEEPKPVVPVEDEAAKKAREERKKKREDLEKAARQLDQSPDADAKKLAETILDDSKELKAKEHVPKLIELMDDNTTDVHLITGGFLVIRHFEDQSSFKSVFRENAGMNTAAKLLGSKEDDIRRATVRFIGDTITKCGSQDNVANAEAFATADGLPLIVKLLTDKEQHIQSMCAGVIRVLSGYEGRTQSGLSFQDDFRKAGAVAPLVTLLQSEQPDMIRQAAGAIRGLAEGNKANRDAFVEADCIAILLKHLEAQADPKVQAHVLSTIYTLTISNSKAAEQIQKGEGIKLLKKEFATDFPEKHELILGIWKNMALDNTAVQNYLREQGILDIIIETINKNTPEKVESKTSSPGQSLSPKEKVQKSSCSALAALTSGNSESISVAMKANMLDKLTKLLDSECDPIVSRSLSAIRSLITKSKANQNKLLEMRPITRTLDLCLAKSTEVRDQAVAVLAQCLGNEKVKKELFSKALPIMIQLIDPVPVPDALAVIQVLLEDESQKAIVTKDKRAISLFVSFLEEKNEKVIINDCSVISALSLGNKSGQNAIVKADAAFKLVKLLGTSSVPIIQHHAAYSIWAVSKNNSKAQNAFGKANAINALVSILKDEKSSDVLKEYSIGALYALVTDNSTNKRSTVSCNGIEAILPLLNAGPQKIRVNAAKALWAMCESHSFFKAPSTSEAILKNQERAAAGIPALVKLLKTDKFNSQAAAASALYSLAHRNTKNQNTLREAGAIPILVSVVKNNYKEFSSGQKNSAQGEAVKWAVITIGALAWKNPANQNALIKEGAVTILEPLRDSNIEWLQREGVIALDHLGAKKAKAPAAEKPKKEEKKPEPKKEETPKPSPAPVKKSEENNNTKKAESSSEEDDSDDSEEESSDDAPKKPETAKIDPKIPDTPKVEQKQPETPKVEPKAAPAPAPKKEESSSEEDSDESESEEEAPKKEEPKKQETPKVEPKSSPAPAPAPKKEESSSEEDSDESESDSE